MNYPELANLENWVHIWGHLSTEVFADSGSDSWEAEGMGL